MAVLPLLIFCLFFFLVSPPCLIHAQQPYVRKATTACGATDNSNTVLGYTCNGLNTACQAYITFRSQSPYNTVSSISQLLNSDPSRVSQINSVPDYSSIIDTDELVVVPVKCLCSGGCYYQSNTHYVVQQDDTYFSIANDTFKGLSTCQALQAENSAPVTSLSIGDRISVPLRCACPTKNQSDNGVKYLLSYLVTWNQDVSDISTIFGVDYKSTPEANELLSDPRFYAFANLLIPLETPPTELEISILSPKQQFETLPPSQTPEPAPSPNPAAEPSSNKRWVYAVVGVIGGVGVLLVIGRFAFWLFIRRRNIRREGFRAI